MRTWIPMVALLLAAACGAPKPATPSDGGTLRADSGFTVEDAGTDAGVIEDGGGADTGYPPTVLHGYAALFGQPDPSGIAVAGTGTEGHWTATTNADGGYSLPVHTGTYALSFAKAVALPQNWGWGDGGALTYTASLPDVSVFVDDAGLPTDAGLASLAANPTMLFPGVLAARGEGLWTWAASPDGAYLAYLTDCTPNADGSGDTCALDVVPSAGGAPVQLAPNVYNLWGTDLNAFTWAPAGDDGGAPDRLAFFAGYTDSANAGTLETASTPGFAPAQVATGVAYYAWSPDGARLGFVDDVGAGGNGTGNGTLQVVSGAGDGLTTVANQVSGDFRWSPDGTKISLVVGYVSNAQSGTLELAPSAGGTASPLSTTYGIPWGADFVSYSPDGSRIAFVDTNGLEVAPVAGGGPTAIVPASAKPDDLSFAWTPDGTRLAFLEAVDANAGTGTLNVAAMDGAGVVQIATGAGIGQFAFYGSRLAYLSGVANGAGTLSVAPAGGSPQAVQSNVTAFAFAPDGRLGFIVGFPGTLYVMPAGGGDHVPVSASNVAEFAFSPDGSLLALLAGATIDETLGGLVGVLEVAADPAMAPIPLLDDVNETGTGTLLWTGDYLFATRNGSPAPYGPVQDGIYGCTLKQAP